MEIILVIILVTLILILVTLILILVLVLVLDDRLGDDRVCDGWRGSERERETGGEGGQGGSECIDDLSADEGRSIHLRPPVTPLSNSADRMDWQIHKYTNTKMHKYTSAQIQ